MKEYLFGLDEGSESATKVVVGLNPLSLAVSRCDFDEKVSQSDITLFTEVKNFYSPLGYIVASGERIGVVRFERDSIGCIQLVIYAEYHGQKCSHNDDYDKVSLDYDCVKHKNKWYSRIGVRISEDLAYIFSVSYKCLKMFLDEITCHCVTSGGQRIVFEMLGQMLETVKS